MSHYFAAAVGVLLTTLGQLTVKSGVLRGQSWRSSFLQPRTIAGNALFLLATMFGTYSLQVVPLKQLIAWSASSYVLVSVASARVFGERVTLQRAIGCGLITAGVILFTA